MWRVNRNERRKVPSRGGRKTVTLTTHGGYYCRKPRGGRGEAEEAGVGNHNSEQLKEAAARKILRENQFSAASHRGKKKKRKATIKVQLRHDQNPPRRVLQSPGW